MARVLVDIELLLVALLAESLPGVTVAASLDVDSVDHLPMVIVRPIDGEAVSNGPIGLAFQWLVNLSFLANSHEAASDLADAGYQACHGYEDTQATVPGVGYVRAVGDDMLPTRTASVTVADNLTQFDGRFMFSVGPA